MYACECWSQKDEGGKIVECRHRYDLEDVVFSAKDLEITH